MKAFYSNKNVWVEMHNCVAWDKVDNQNPQNASLSEIKEPYEPSPRMVSYEQPSCLGSTFVAYDKPIGDLDMMEDKMDNPSPQSTPQVLPSFEVYTPPMTYPKEVDETTRIPMEEIMNGNLRAGIFKENKKIFSTDPRDDIRINPDGVARLYLTRRSLEVLRKFHWMVLGG
nr:ribonuclease H-like domain-containing protein [Tanacetum cinerariifolium]